jgi:hypothetical protein
MEQLDAEVEQDEQKVARPRLLGRIDELGRLWGCRRCPLEAAPL